MPTYKNAWWVGVYLRSLLCLRCWVGVLGWYPYVGAHTPDSLPWWSSCIAALATTARQQRGIDRHRSPLNLWNATRCSRAYRSLSMQGSCMHTGTGAYLLVLHYSAGVHSKSSRWHQIRLLALSPNFSLCHFLTVQHLSKQPTTKCGAIDWRCVTATWTSWVHCLLVLIDWPLLLDVRDIIVLLLHQYFQRMFCKYRPSFTKSHHVISVSPLHFSPYL